MYQLCSSIITAICMNLLNIQKLVLAALDRAPVLGLLYLHDTLHGREVLWRNHCFKVAYLDRLVHKVVYCFSLRRTCPATTHCCAK